MLSAGLGIFILGSGLCELVDTGRNATKGNQAPSDRDRDCPCRSRPNTDEGESGPAQPPMAVPAAITPTAVAAVPPATETPIAAFSILLLVGVCGGSGGDGLSFVGCILLAL